MNRLLLLLLLSFSIISLAAQDYWETYRQDRGLVDSVIVDLAKGTDQIFIATPRGFSVFKDGSFTNFDTSNSNIASQNIKQLATYNDTVWMATDSGLSQYFNGVITNFDTADGLINDTIQDMAVTSDGELWIATLRGISRKRGIQFTNDPSRETHFIAINGGDSVYAVVNFGSIFNAPGFTSVEMYDGNSWRSVSDPNLSRPIEPIKMYRLSNGRVVILSKVQGAYTIENEFELNPLGLPERDTEARYLLDLKLADTSYWAAYGYLPFDFRQAALFYVGLVNWNSNLYGYHYNGLPNPYILAVEVDDEKVYIGTKDGLGVASRAIKPFPRQDSLSNSKLKLSMAADGRLFNRNVASDQKGLGWEFPKGSGRNLIYYSALWLYGVDQQGTNKLATQIFNAGDYGLGPSSDNSTPFRPNLYKISRDQVQSHINNYNDPGYNMPEVIRQWPANGYAERGEAADQAPFIDVNNNSCYDPENGDYPFILGDQAILTIINDNVQPTTGLFTENLGVDLYIMTYIFDQPQIDHISQSVFVRYTIVNRSRYIYDLKSAIFLDLDLGNPINDLFYSVPSADAQIFYNATLTDDDDLFGTSPYIGYDSIHPAMGVKLINERMSGSTFLPFVNQNSTFNSAMRRPQVLQHYYNRFNNRWNDSSPYVRTGFGYDPNSDDTTNYLFTGDPLDPNSWSANNLNASFGLEDGLEISTFLNIKGSTLRPNQRKIIDVVYSVAYDSTVLFDNLAMIPVVKKQLNLAANFQKGVDSLAPKFTYSNCFVGEEELALEQQQDPLLLYPNPNDGNFSLQTELRLKRLQIFNVQGKLVQEISLNEQQTTHNLQLALNKSEGLFILRAIDQEGKVFTKRFLVLP